MFALLWSSSSCSRIKWLPRILTTQSKFLKISPPCSWLIRIIPPVIWTRPVTYMIANIYFFSGKNLFIQFHLFPVCFIFVKIATWIPLKKWAYKPSLLVSDEQVAVLMNKLKQCNHWSKRTLNQIFDSARSSKFIPKAVIQKDMHHYSFNLFINWRFSAWVCCIGFQRWLFVVWFLISHLKFSHRLDWKLRTLERLWCPLCSHENGVITLLLRN